MASYGDQPVLSELAEDTSCSARSACAECAATVVAALFSAVRTDGAVVAYLLGLFTLPLLAVLIQGTAWWWALIQRPAAPGPHTPGLRPSGLGPLAA